MAAQQRRDSEWQHTERSSGVRSRVREEDIDTVPPPPPDLEDVHARETVNRKLSPEFLSYLRSFDAPGVPAIDPVVPEPWVGEPDDGPVVEVHEDLGDPFAEEHRDADPGDAPAELDLSVLHAEEEVPSFRDHRATVIFVGLAVAVVAGVAALFVT